MVEKGSSIYDSGPANKIQIFISCRKLKDLDIISKTDPVVKVSIRDSKQKNYTQIGQTEVIHNNLNPDFTKHFTVDYFFEKEQFVKFDVYDVDNVKNDYIGFVEVTVGKLMASPNQTFIDDI